MKTDSYTSVAQAEILVKLGVDPNTADMSYQNKSLKGVTYTNPFKPYMTPYSVDVESMEKLKKEFTALGDSRPVGIMNDTCVWETKPCWSVGALIDLIPFCCVKSDPICERYYVSCGSQETDSDALVGALIEMICVLKERNMI